MLRTMREERAADTDPSDEQLEPFELPCRQVSRAGFKAFMFGRFHATAQRAGCAEPSLWDTMPPWALPSCSGYLARWDIELRGI